jgi:hypothetical protein
MSCCGKPRTCTLSELVEEASCTLSLEREGRVRVNIKPDFRDEIATAFYEWARNDTGVKPGVLRGVQPLLV